MRKRERGRERERERGRREGRGEGKLDLKGEDTHSDHFSHIILFLFD